MSVALSVFRGWLGAPGHVLSTAATSRSGQGCAYTSDLSDVALWLSRVWTVVPTAAVFPAPALPSPALCAASLLNVKLARDTRRPDGEYACETRSGLVMASSVRWCSACGS